jgi:hypothetical protein
MEITGIMEALGSFFGETIALINLSQHQAASICGYLATLQVDDDLLGEKTFKAELFMAECVQRYPA